MDNHEAREMEILALESIYEKKDFIVDGTDPPSGRFVAHVRLPQLFNVKTEVTKDVSPHEPGNTLSREEIFEVEYLPPITLFFEFSEDYPAETPPGFLLSCNWLTLEQLTKVCQQLESLWEQNKDAILFMWIQFLQDEVLEFLGINQCLDITPLLQFKIKNNFLDKDTTTEKEISQEESSCDENDPKKCNFRNSYLVNIQPSVYGGSGAVDSRAFNDLPDGKMLVQLLKNYNVFKKEEVFKSTSHICDICFLLQEGSDFITFKTCKHSFCISCLKSYFEVQIQEGNVNSLNCPEGKCTTQADGSVVRQVVSLELYEKYDRLLLSRTLEGMADIAYCPRRECQCPLILEACGRMGACPACNFVFCPFCKMTYHGVAPCRFKSSEKAEICEKYLQGSPEEKAEMEQKYGKKSVKAIIEEALSEAWIETNSKNCPHCNASIEKTDGCNKMTCFRCGTYFCWLCTAELKHSNPYSHFDQRGTRCYRQLFPEEYLDNQFEFEAGEFLRF